MRCKLVQLAAILIIVAGVVGLVYGLTRDDAESSAAAGGDDLEEVIDRLLTDFIHRADITDDELREAAIQGVIDFISDPYTAYLPPHRHQAFLGELEGQAEYFEGIGASVTFQNGHIVILGPLPGSPAERANILPGDVVLAVDGQPVEDLTLDETVALIRGPKDTSVVLTVSRSGASLPFDVTVVRDTINVSSVLARMQAPGVGYIQVASFDAATAGKFRAALDDLRERGAEGFIVDLRNNGGGIVEAAVAVVSEFVREGEVVRWVDASGEEALERVSGDGSAYETPLVVIVNGFSASASEIVVGALQDHNRAVIVGTRTYGKGSVNLLHSLESGAGLYVTIARWLTPDGREIEGEGLDPDVEVGDALDVQALARLGDLSRSLCGVYADEADSLGGQDALVDALDRLCNIEPQASVAPSTDEQLDAAIAELERMLGR